MLAALLLPAAAWAACINPAGSAGDTIFNRDWRTEQYCDNFHWVSMAKPTYQPQGVVFDGTNDYLTSTSNFNTADDGKLTVSFWFRRSLNFGTAQTVFRANNTATVSAANLRVLIQFTTTNKIQIQGSNQSGTAVLSVTTGSTFTDSNWHHIVFSLDLSNNAKRFIYIDGVADSPTWNTYNTGQTFDFSMATPRNSIGATSAGGAKYAGDLADFWLDEGFYIDLSVAANLQKFISTGGNPVYLGAIGELIDGVNNEAFLTNPLSSWQTNTVTGEPSFTVNGALADADPVTTGDITTGLVNWWKMDESSGTTANDSAGNFPGTFANSPSWQPTGGKDGGAILIDGSDDSNDDNNPQLDLGTTFDFPAVPFTLSAWVKPTNYTDWRTIIGKRDIGGSGTERLQWQMTLSTGAVGLFSSNASINFTYIAPLATWTHLVAVASASNTKLYVNGILEETSATVFSFANCAVACHTAIGDNGEWLTRGSGVSADSDPFKGSIDDVRIYSRALTDDDVRKLYNEGYYVCAGPASHRGTIVYNGGSNHVMQYCDGATWRPMGPVPGTGGGGCSSPAGSEGHMLYNSASQVMQYCDGTKWISIGGPPSTPSASGLIGYWKLDEGSTTSTADSSGSGNGGTLANGAAWTTGKNTNGILFDNNNDSVDIANESNFDFNRTNPFTVTAWIYRQSNTSEDDIVEKYDGTTVTGWALWFDVGSNNLIFDLLNTSTNKISVTTATPVSLNAWHFVAATYSGSSAASGVQIYVDGVLQTMTIGTDALTASILNNKAVTIGNEVSGATCCAFDGKIDEVRIYNRALTGGEIRDIYDGS
ncbi:MAG TPA: LamG-like jellyroll fold domain-containing protein [Patescibacteria group bacterium]|nr:LamG-like jellyroll fold domain-containing protein [Patescibacteria group bacterium]